MLQLINTIYTLLTLALLLLIVNYFGNFIVIPKALIIVVLVLSAFIFFLRMYMRITQRKP